jgi:hypothetical protein
MSERIDGGQTLQRPVPPVKAGDSVGSAHRRLVFTFYIEMAAH